MIRQKLMTPVFIRIGVGILLVNTLCVLFARTGWINNLFATILIPIQSLSAALVTLFISLRIFQKDRILGGVWFLIALALSFNSLGDWSLTITQQVFKPDLGSSISDLFYLIYYPLMFAAALRMPRDRVSINRVITKLLDMLVITGSTLLTFWNLVVIPLIQTGIHQSFWSYILSLIYPIANIILMVGLLTLCYFYFSANKSWSVLLLALGMATVIVGDISYSILDLLGTYTAGGWPDFTYTVSYVLTALAAVIQYDSIGRKIFRIQFHLDEKFHWTSHVPYAWLILAYVQLILAIAGRIPMRTGDLVLWVGGLTVLVLIRQILTTSDNLRLNDQKELLVKQLREQADELTKANQKLQMEVFIRKQAEERAIHDSLHDMLTGLPNRAFFTRELDTLSGKMRRQTDFRYAVFLLDLDGFKNVNDTFGHAAGDELLVETARRLRNSLREQDLVARLGGDEFSILLNGISEEETLAIADRIQIELKEPILLGASEVVISASIGIVMGNQPGEQRDLLRDADIAMYKVKANGKNGYLVFDDQMRSHNPQEGT